MKCTVLKSLGQCAMEQMLFKHMYCINAALFFGETFSSYAHYIKNQHKIKKTHDMPYSHHVKHDVIHKTRIT